MIPKPGIRFRVIALVNLVILLMSVIIVTAVVLHVRSDLRERAYSQQLLQTNLIAHSIENNLRSATEMLQYSALMIRPDKVNDKKAMRLFLEQRASGRIFYNNGISVLNAKGHLVAAVPENSLGGDKDHSKKPYYLKTMKTGRPLVAETVPTTDEGVSAIVFTAPVKDSNGIITGMFVGSIDLMKGNFLRELTGHSSGKGDYFYIANRGREIIVHPDYRRILRADIALGKNRLFDAAMERGFEGSGQTVNSHGIRQLVTVRQLPQSDWILFATYPCDSLYEKSDYIARLLVLILATAMILVNWILWAFGERLSRDLKRFARHLEMFPGMHGAKRHIEPPESDDLAPLVKGSNLMVDKISDNGCRSLKDSVFYSNSMGIVVVSGERTILEINPSLCEATGYEAHELIGMSAEVFHLSTKAYIAFGKLCQQMAPYGRVEIEYRMRHRSGRIMYGHFTGSPIDRDDPSKGTIWMIQDIMERKILEKALKDATARAEAANRAKSSFLASMSHEIRTPMNAIIGMAGILEGTSLDDDQKECLKMLKSSSVNLMGIISEILDFSRIEAGRVVIEPVPMQPVDICNDVMEMLSVTAQQKGIALKYKSVAKLPVLKGDAGKIRQVLTNLLGNAIKFTEKGFVQIEMSGVPDNSGGFRVTFAVRDTGCGIPENGQSELFKEFTQLAETKNIHSQGTGLGLAISKKLVELMGGEIGFKSTYGTGSTFWFTIPLSLSDGAKSDAKQPSAQQADPPVFMGVSVLVVDDNRVNQRVAQRILEKQGCRVDLADDGKEGVVMFQEGHYDLILMDILMPHMDGFEATAAIRRIESEAGNNRTPVVALTANALSGVRERCLDSGMDDFLPKPFSNLDLILRVAKWLPGRSSVPDSAAG